MAEADRAMATLAVTHHRSPTTRRDHDGSAGTSVVRTDRPPGGPSGKARMSTRLRVVAGLVVCVLVAVAAIVDTIVSSPVPTLIGSWGGHQCAQVTVAHPVTLPNLGRGRGFGGLPYPSTVDAAGSINLVLTRHFSDDFSGITLSHDNVAINIYATSLPRGLRFAVAQLAPKGSISYRRCGNTLSSLSAVQHALNDQGTALASRGIDLGGYGPTITSNCEEIDVVRLTQAQLVFLRQDFGADKICVHGITSQQVAAPL